MAERRLDFPEVAEIHQRGLLGVENLEHVLSLHSAGALVDCDVGLQTHFDGRIWICVNGIAFLRFKPNPTTKEK